MDITEIQDFLGTLSASAQAGDVDRIMSNFHPTARAFEFGQTRQTLDLAGIRENCERGYHEVGKVKYEFAVERIEAAGETAYCYGLEHVSGERSGQPFELYGCATYVLRRFDGRWAIVHQHLTTVE